MGREVRKVAADWVHPIDPITERYKPLFDGASYKRDATEFMAVANEKGLQEAVDWFGRSPDQNDYMPAWADEQKTHLMMYEDTSEGTPISPAFTTPEELARWLADTGASAFGKSTASYEGWLNIARGGFAPSLIVQDGQMINGVDASVAA